jgi:prevent-host-death family protein
MREVSVREARENFRSLLDCVAGGEEILVVRRGKPIARLVPAVAEGKRLPALDDFRASIEIKGGSLGEELAAARREERS